MRPTPAVNPRPLILADSLVYRNQNEPWKSRHRRIWTAKSFTSIILALNSSTQKDRKPVRRKKHWALRIVRAGVLVYLGLCVVLFFAQDWILFPAHAHQGKPEARLRPERDNLVLKLTTANGDTVYGIFGAALLPDGLADPTSIDRPTILYFYGNGGALAWSMGEFDLFRRLDANVLMIDYPGFGMSSGKPTEKSLYASADAAYDYAVQDAGVAPANIVPLGWSLGAAVAIDLASRRPVGGLAVFNAFTNIGDMGHQLIPGLPTWWLLKYRFDNLSKISGIKCPMLICNGKLDLLVSPKMSDRLAAAAGGKVTRVTIDAADHNTIFVADPAGVASALKSFLDTLR